MSKKIVARLAKAFLLVVAISVIAADLVVLAQDQSSSAQQNANMSNANTTKPRRRGKVHRRATNRNTAADATNAAEANTNVATEQTETSTNMAAAKPRRRGGCDPSQQEQKDLSGTYNGRVDYPDGGLTGDATLTITGNDFTLTSGATTPSGRITAVTTCGYTAATMMFGVATPKPGEQVPPSPTVSLRAKKTGGRLALTSVSGEKHSFTFETVGRARRSRRKASMPATPAEPAAPPAEPAAPTEPAMPANPETPPEAGPAPAESAKPATPRRKAKRRVTKKPTANSNSNTP